MKDYFSSSETSKDLIPYSEPGVPAARAEAIPLPIPGGPEAMLVGVAVELVETTIKCFTDYLMCREHEETARRGIAAQLEATLAQIEATKEKHKDIIERSFNERSSLYDKALKTIDHALELNDIEMLKVAYNFILNVYEKAPNININIE